MGKSESAECDSNRIEAEHAHDLSGRQKENRGSAAGAVGEGQSRQEGWLEVAQHECG
jgi:hypothetical protein